MAQPTHSEIQVVDPVLSNMLLGYQQADSRFVANRVFPLVPIDKQSFTYYIFTKSYWFSNNMKARAVGNPFPRAGYGVSSTTGYANTFGLEHPIAKEARANNQTPMSLEQAGAAWLAQQSMIHREVSFATDFMKTGVWGTDNTSATDWDDFSAGDPFSDVLTAKRTISNATGTQPNRMVLGYIVDVALQNHPDIVDRIKHVQIAGPGNVRNALSSLFGLEYIVAEGSYNSANEGQTASIGAIIDDDCLICYSNPTPQIMMPSAGYTFAWAGGGGGGEIATYSEPQTKTDMVLQLSEAWDQKAVATDVGYFFSDIV